MEGPKRTIAYICPSCRRSVIVERTAFQLAVAPNTLPCPCGKSALRVEMEGPRTKLTVPCVSCGREHTVSCSTHAFLHERTLAFSCAASGLDCCYVGEEGSVFAATRRLEEAVDKLEQDAGSRGVFLDELVMQEVLAELREIAGRGGVTCECGSREWKLRVNFSSVDVICPHCGGVLRLSAATASDIEDICCRDKLVIRKKSG